MALAPYNRRNLAGVSIFRHASWFRAISLSILPAVKLSSVTYQTRLSTDPTSNMATMLEIPATVPTANVHAASTALTGSDLKGPSSSLPPVLEFDAEKCTSDDLVAALKISGGVIIRNFLTTTEVATIEADVRPWLDKDKHWDGNFFPKETRRAFGLVGKSKTFALRVVGHELWLEVCDALLTSELKGNWVGCIPL